jgi:hypothetical protein
MDFGVNWLTDINSIKEYPLSSGTLHYLGASSSPDIVFISAVNKDYITYYKPPFKQPLRLERRIASDLIRSGDRTAKARGDKWVGKKTNLADLERKEIYVKAPESEWSNLDKINSSLGYNMVTGEFSIYGSNLTIRKLKKAGYKITRVVTA